MSHLRQLLAELVQPLLKWCPLRLGGDHRLADFADLSVNTCADDNTTRLAGGNVRAREEHVLLVLLFSSCQPSHANRCTHLVDSARVGYWFIVLDDRHRLASQNRLIDANGGRVDLHYPNVSRDLVTDCRPYVRLCKSTTRCQAHLTPQQCHQAPAHARGSFARRGRSIEPPSPFPAHTPSMLQSPIRRFSPVEVIR